jgi:hypothetical protein
LERFLHYYLGARLLIIPRRWQRHQPVIIIIVDAVIISDDPVVSPSVSIWSATWKQPPSVSPSRLTTFHRSSRRHKKENSPPLKSPTQPSNHAPGTHPEPINLCVVFEQKIH